MTYLRKLEALSGLTTALLGATVTLNMLRTDYETMLRLNEDFPVFQELSVGLLLFLFPSLLVAVGSYLHAARRQPRGLVILTVSTFVLTFIFVGLFFALAFRTANLSFWLNLLLSVIAIVTMIIGLIVRAQD
jgi:amino acid transporter